MEEIRARQDAVKELSFQTDFRHALVVEARLTSEQKADPGVFIAWAEHAPPLAPVKWSRPLAWALPIATTALFALGALGLIPGVFGWLALALQLGVVVLTRKTLGAYYSHLSAGETGFARFEHRARALVLAGWLGALILSVLFRVAGATETG